MCAVSSSTIAACTALSASADGAPLVSEGPDRKEAALLPSRNRPGTIATRGCVGRKSKLERPSPRSTASSTSEKSVGSGRLNTSGSESTMALLETGKRNATVGASGALSRQGVAAALTEAGSARGIRGGPVKDERVHQNPVRSNGLGQVAATVTAQADRVCAHISPALPVSSSNRLHCRTSCLIRLGHSP